jgi:hypothetical protein
MHPQYGSAKACAQNWRHGNEIGNGPYGWRCAKDSRYNNKPGHLVGNVTRTGVNNEKHTLNVTREQSYHTRN